MTVTMIKNTNWVLPTIFLSVFSYSYKATGFLDEHVNCDGHPEDEVIRNVKKNMILTSPL